MWTWLKRQAWPGLQATWRGWRQHDGALLSAAMAYYAAFSLFPLLLLFLAAVGCLLRFFPDAQFQQQQLIDLIAANVSPWLAGQLERVMVGLQLKAGVGGPIGLATLIIGALGVFVQLRAMFDRIWGRAETGRGWLSAAREALSGGLVAFLMLLGVGTLLAVLFIADITLAWLQPYVVQLPTGRIAWQAGRTLLAVVGNAMLLGVIYKTLAPTSVRWRDALSGGLLVAITWKAGQEILASVIIGEHYSAYGVVGSFIAVMLWFYYASAVVFLGAEFVHALSGTELASPPAAPRQKG